VLILSADDRACSTFSSARKIVTSSLYFVSQDCLWTVAEFCDFVIFYLPQLTREPLESSGSLVTRTLNGVYWYFTSRRKSARSRSFYYIYFKNFFNSKCSDFSGGKVSRSERRNFD